MTAIRLTDAGRAAIMDGANRSMNAIQLRSLQIGDGTGPGGMDDDALTALRSLKQTVDLVGTTLQAGRLAVRGEFVPTEVFSVTEAGIVARIGAAGQEFLFAYWAVPQASDAVANTAVGVTLIIAVALDVVNVAAEVSVTLSPTITIAGAATLVELTDAPNAISPHRYLRGDNTGTAVVWGEAPPVVATEAALPAVAAAVASSYLVLNYNSTGAPVFALKAAGQWWYLYARENFPLASQDQPGIVELSTVAEALAGASSTLAITPAGLRAVRDALVGGAPGALDTLDELAAALNDDAGIAATLTNLIATKAALAGAIFTGPSQGLTRGSGGQQQTLCDDRVHHSGAWSTDDDQRAISLLQQRRRHRPRNHGGRRGHRGQSRGRPRELPVREADRDGS